MNRLANEKSPYLLQHKDNPVNWYPWGEEALNKAKEVIKKLNDGADFAKLAKEYSSDSSNASKGGDLGYFNTGDMAEEFETAAYKLKLNEYTKEPVKTKFGYHIILKTGEKGKS